MFQIYGKIYVWGSVIVQLFNQVVVMIVGVDGVLGIKVGGYLFEYGVVIVIKVVYQVLVDGVVDFGIVKQCVQVGKVGF